MNERIKLLAVQAGAEFDDWHAVSLLNDEVKKFAQLIVRECMSLVSEPGPAMNDTERGILALIKHHFGVE